MQQNDVLIEKKKSKQDNFQNKNISSEIMRIRRMHKKTKKNKDC